MQAVSSIEVLQNRDVSQFAAERLALFQRADQYGVFFTEVELLEIEWCSGRTA